MEQQRHDFGEFNIPTMSEVLFKKFRDLIYSQTGIQLVDGKRTMVSARLARRVRAVGLKSFRDYFKYIQTDEGAQAEMTMLVDVITTNKTDFCREKHHFEMLTQKILPFMQEHYRYTHESPLTIWSAGCSSGEEPYTLSMNLAEYFKGDLDRYKIVATDISRRILRRAKNGVYDAEIVQPIPAYLKHRYLMTGTGKQKGKYRVVPEIRDRILFGYYNLMEPQTPFDHPIDMIFCRNVIIYFDTETKRKLIRRYFNTMKPGGFLFIGHSETLTGISDDFKLVGQTVYQRPL